MWSKDADCFGDSFPLNREHLDLDSMLVQSSEDLMGCLQFPWLLRTQALVQASSLGHEPRDIPM